MFSPAAARGQAQPLDPVLITGDPVAPYIPMEGTGLCAAYRPLRDADLRFPPAADRTRFPTDVNRFLDPTPQMGGPGFGPRVDRTLRTRFDLSNNITTGDTRSIGDFTMADVGCVDSGCPFPVGDTMMPGIGARFRGFLNVPPAWAGPDEQGRPRTIHFGFYADDAVAMSIFDKSKVSSLVVSRGPRTGTAQWRVTNTVIFRKPGLYPIEITYAQIDIAAALEVAVLVGPFADIEEPARMGAGQITLRDARFQLVAPTLFFQTVLGVHPFRNVTQCQQCPRDFAGAPGGGDLVGCPDEYFCNEAAVCAPCREGLHCGARCMPCQPPRPVCADINGVHQCVQCVEDADCELTYPGGNRKCDKRTYTCEECNVDADCPKGKRCEQNKCVPCASDTQCAGSSCTCCPPSAPRCIDAGDGQFVCSQCRADSDCPRGQVCDLQNRRCVEKVAECNTNDRCGASCAPCPREQIGDSPPRPFCLEGKVCVQCRSDLDCGPGRYCLSGDCVPCTTDRRCGPTCRSCGGDTPFCKPAAAAEAATCVRCLTDAHCAGGVCDPETNTCTSRCEMDCPRGTFCDGQRCVECYANTHCPCGGSCLLSVHQCSDECESTSDCLATQCCSKITRRCEPGRCKPGVGVLCCDASLGKARDGLSLGQAVPAGTLLALALLLLSSRLLLGRRSRRQP
ncbi:MAG: outer membrane exchange protein TraA family protein [Myxococcales bacterium]|nr:hypothetical protein [Myxococcota bacterium]MDW8282491.1 outer membrane exchange protein TraA family protein [Myxococcales bacterium]